MEITVTLDCQAEVAHRLAAFSEGMAEQIRAHEQKGSWGNLTSQHLMANVRSHAHELEQAQLDYTSGKMAGDIGRAAIRKATLDLANYCFFIADNWNVIELDSVNPS